MHHVRAPPRRGHTHSHPPVVTARPAPFHPDRAAQTETTYRLLPRSQITNKSIASLIANRKSNTKLHLDIQPLLNLTHARRDFYHFVVTRLWCNVTLYRSATFVVTLINEWKNFRQMFQHFGPTEASPLANATRCYTDFGGRYRAAWATCKSVPFCSQERILYEYMYAEFILASSKNTGNTKKGARTS